MRWRAGLRVRQLSAALPPVPRRSIKQLTKLINDNCPGAVKEGTLGDLNGRKIAIDASMAIYQFLVAVRSAGEGGGASAQLTNEAGEVTR